MWYSNWPLSEDNTIIGTPAWEYIDGKKGDDTLFGMGGADWLDGGPGKDVLDGGADCQADIYHMRLCDLREGGWDQITSWDYDNDSVRIGRDPFAIDCDQFVNGKHALDSNDRVIYNEENGKLWLDPDGSGPKDKIKVAVVNDSSDDGHPTLYFNDVLIPDWLV
jgi:Ca2+-binding RTX toxin-like protein